MGETLNVLIADDHTLIRETLTELLGKLAEDVKVLQADSFDNAARLVANSALDLVILDMVMPGMHRLEGLDSLHRQYPDLPIVILSGLAQPADVVEAMHLGAAGFIPKTIGGRGMLRALQMILAGERYVPPMALEQQTQPSTDPSPTDVVGAGSTVERTDQGANAIDQKVLSSLSKRERQVLQLLVTGRSNRLIADSLGVREVTVKAHLRSLFRKLGVSNRVEAVMHAISK